MELNNLTTESSKLRMTPAEKAAMRASVFAAPLGTNKNSVSPIAAQPSSYFAYSFQFMHARVLVPAMAFVLVFGGVSTTAAAYGALPGEFLYPVKISINEAVEVALATTPVARAEVSVKQAVRRVEEAEVLAARGELTQETGQELAANFEAHAEQANQLANKLEAEDPAAAESLRTRLDSSLSAHGEILAMMTVGGAEANQEAAGVVAASVLSRTIASALPARSPAALRSSKAVSAPALTEPATTIAMTMSVATDAASSSEASGTVALEADLMVQDAQGGEDREQEQAAIGFKQQAQAQLAAVRATFNKNKGTLAGSSITQVSGELREIEEMMELGSTTLATGHYAEAQSDFGASIRRAIKLHVLLGVQAKLEQNIISPILEKSLEEATIESRTDL